MTPTHGPPATNAGAGRVIFVSAGPGAADLITLRGARALSAADVVLSDALVDPALHEWAPRALWVDVGKRGYARATAQAAIDAMLVHHALAGRVVVRLKGGDAGVFGRLEEELQALAGHGIACEVVPGVTAALAAAAQTRRPLTRRGHGRSVALSTAMGLDGATRPARHADTEVFYMAGRQLGALGRRLLAAGWAVDTPVHVVSRAGWPDARASEHALGDLGAAALLHAGRPTVVIVGAGAPSPVPQAVPGSNAAARAGTRLAAA